MIFDDHGICGIGRDMKTRNRGLYVLSIVSLVMTLLLPSGCQRLDALIHSNQCVFSDRPIRPDMAVKIAVEKGKEGGACCVRCAITYSKQTGKTVRILSVTDFPTRRPIAPARATYVTGGDLNQCMGPPGEASLGHRGCETMTWDRCAPSSIAFAKREDAENFQRIHGGRIQTFAEIVASAKVVAQ